VTQSLVRSSCVAPEVGRVEQHLLDMWLHGRPEHTQRAYLRDPDGS
jgi:hypothetical protein